MDIYSEIDLKGNEVKNATFEVVDLKDLNYTPITIPNSGFLKAYFKNGTLRKLDEFGVEKTIAENFAANDLVFDANRNHSTAGFEYSLSTDDGAYSEAWQVLNPSEIKCGFANNALKVDTNGVKIFAGAVASERLTVLSSNGFVGVNQTNPTAMFEIKANSYVTTETTFLIKSHTNIIDLVKINGLGKIKVGFDGSNVDGFIIEPQLSEFSQLSYGGLKIQSLTNVQGYFGYGVAAYKFGIGTNSPAARLDVKAQGALSSDIVFRVRNSADNDDIIKIMGNMTMNLLGSATGGYLNLSRTTGGNVKMMHRATAVLPSIFQIHSLGDGGAVGQIQFDAFDGATAAFTIQRLLSGLSDLTGASLYSAFGVNTAAFIMKNATGYGGYGTTPTGTATDHFAMYSADISAGNAAPHFRTENGSIIKLFTGASLTASLTALVQNPALIFTPTYTLTPLASGGFGFATKDEAETFVMTTINLQTRVRELETRFRDNGLLS